MLSLHRWRLRVLRQTGAADSPEVRLVRFLAEQVSLPKRAGGAMSSVDAFFKLDRARQQRELPHVYLILEQYLTEVDPVRRLSRSQVRESVRSEFPELIWGGPLALVFEPPDRQEILLCREFLLAVLERTLQVLGGDANSPLRIARQWLQTAPDNVDEPVPFDAADGVPADPAAWIETMVGIARGLHRVLDRSMGQGSDRIYDASYASVAHPYGGLESFPVVIRLLPEGLLDEQRIQSLSRHRAFERVQGALSDARRSALESASQLQAVLNTVGEGILTVNATGEIVLANREIEQLLGFESAGLIGESLSLLLDADDPAATLLTRSLAEGETGSFPLGRRVQIRGRRKDGTIVPLELSLNETRISGELYYTAALQDVTIRMEYERGLVEAKEHAEEMDRMKSAFLANISHELRTPLSGIMGSAQLLAEDIDDEKREFTQFIMESGQRLLDTLSAILEFSRLESGAVAARIERIPLRQKITRIAEEFRARAEAKNLSLEIELPQEELEVDASSSSLERLLGILLENALKFTQQGSVTVRLERSADCAVVRIRDTGIGIETEFLSNLFMEFRQESDGLSRSHEGAGLGLAIARRLVETMKGTISVESTKGVGSTFSVQIPLSSATRSSLSPARAHSSPSLR